MKVKFIESFFDSLDKLQRYEAWHNRIWRAITGDFWQFLKNIWRFRKELWDHRWWDYRFTLMTLKRSLIIMEKGMHDGMEVYESRSKKIEKMQRAIAILNNITDDNYISMAEAELGELIMRDWEFEDSPDHPGCKVLVDNDTPEEKEHNGKVFARSREIEEAEWNEFWKIMQGQDYDKFNKDQEWNDQFDGTGIRGWWD